MRSLATTVACLAAALALAGCGDDPENSPSPETSTADPDAAADTGALTADAMSSGLVSPWGLVPFEDGSVLVSERNTGNLVLIDAEDPSRSLLARTIEESVPGGEAGLLGLATTQDESTVFAYYTTSEESRVVRMTRDGADLGEPEIIFDGIPGGAGFHQGGGLAIGPDDLLYVSTGDNGVPENSQDTDSLSGKILRLTLEGDPAPGNAFDNAVYSYGHRNVEGLAFDDQDRLWASEFGQNTYDELNLIEPGANYGWPEVEGSSDREEFVNPQAVWSTADASPSGLAFWDGSLWMAALRGETLWEIPLEGDGAGEPIAQLAGEYGRLRNAAPTADGSALLLATSNTDGRGEPAADDDRLVRLTR